MQDSDPKDLFVFLDVNNKGYLESESFAKVFRQNQIACDDRQMKCLFKMFRRRVDDKIMYMDFARLLEVWFFLVIFLFWNDFNLMLL